MANEIYCGPIDYAVFAVPAGAQVSQGLSLLLDQADRGAIELLDLEIVGRGLDGWPVRLDLSSFTFEDGFDPSVFDGAVTNLLDDDDLTLITEAIDAGQLAIAILYEDRSLAAVATAFAAEGGRELWAGGVDVEDLADRLAATAEGGL